MSAKQKDGRLYGNLKMKLLTNDRKEPKCIVLAGFLRGYVVERSGKLLANLVAEPQQMSPASQAPKCRVFKFATLDIYLRTQFQNKQQIDFLRRTLPRSHILPCKFFIPGKPPFRSAKASKNWNFSNIKQMHPCKYIDAIHTYSYASMSYICYYSTYN